MPTYFIAPDDILDENGGLAFHKGQRVQVDESSPMFTPEALKQQGLVDERMMPAREPGAREVIDTLVNEVADGNIGELFQDPTGESSTPAYIAKTAIQGAADSVVHGAVGLEKGIVGGALDVASAGARLLGGGKLADDLQRAKRFNNEVLMDTKPADDLLLGSAFDNSREAWEKVMGVSESLGSIAGGVAAAKSLAAGLKAAKVAKTAEGAMKGAFAAQMAAGGEENARAQILQGENRDLTWRERAEVAYHTAKEAIKSQFFGRVVGAFGKKIGNVGAAALEFGGINAADVLADAYIGDNIAGRQWKDENGNVLTGNDKDMSVLKKAGAEFLYGGMQSLLMSMGGGIVGAPKEVAANRAKVVKEPPPVVAEGANGERVLEGGVLVRPVEGGAKGELEMVTPDGVVLDAEGNVKTVAAGDLRIADGSWQMVDGSAPETSAQQLPTTNYQLPTRTNPLTGRPTAARETVRNAFVALQEGVTIDQLREIDGWTPENKAVFETVARLKGEIGGAAGTSGTGNLSAPELVDAYARLGLGRAELRAFGLMVNEDAAVVAQLGTRQLADAAGGEVPLDIAAEVARSVNAGTTGLMPKELAKRQLETARQLMAERAKAKLEESAAEHGNTPEAERAVLDTPVEKEDGTLQPLSRLEGEGKGEGKGVGEGEGNLNLNPNLQPPGTSNTLRARHEREQSVKALGLKPLGDGAYGVGRFPQMRVEKADGVSDDSGRPVSAIRVTGLDPAEMLRPENILDMARVLGDLHEKCAERGVRVDFDPEAMDAVNEVMAKWETDVRQDPVLRARSEVVTSLLEKSGLASGIVTDQAAFEAALRAAGGEKAEKLIVDGLTYGFTDGERVYLNPAFFGTKVGLNTPIHEFGHLGIIACRKINRPLYDRGLKLIQDTPYWKEVTEHPDYKADTPQKNAEEALTRLIADRGEKLAAETPKGVLAEIKQWLVEFWKTFGDALGLREITPEQVEKMTVEQIADAIRAEMLRGERFGTSRAQVEAQQQGGRRLKAGQRKRSPKSYIEAGGGKASNAFIFWAENGKRIMNVPKPGEFGWDIYNQLVLGVKDPAERARVKRILCGDQPKNTRLKGNDEILAEFNRRMGGDGDIYTNESGFHQMVEEFLASHADYERWRAEGAKGAEEMEADRLEEEAAKAGRGARPARPQETDSAALEAELFAFDPAELEEWGRMYDESRLAMAEAGLADEPDARVPDDAMWARGGIRFARAIIGGRETAVAEGNPLSKKDAKDPEKVLGILAPLVGKSAAQIGEMKLTRISEKSIEHLVMSEHAQVARKQGGNEAKRLWRGTVGGMSVIDDIVATSGLGSASGASHLNKDWKKSAKFYTAKTRFAIEGENGYEMYPCKLVVVELKNGERYVYDLTDIGLPTHTAKVSSTTATPLGNTASEVTATAVSAGQAFSFGGAERQLLRRAKGTVHSVSDYGSPVKGVGTVGTQPDSQQFKRWFADSKVVDRAGRPRVVYHGTPNGKFWIFDKNRIGETWNADETGFFFTSDRKIAEDYTKPYFRENSADPNLFAVYLSIKNPLVIDRNWWQRNYGRSDIYNHDAIEIWDNEQGTILDEMRKGGHDGVIIDPNPMGGAAKMYMVPEPTQIKSATDNIGTFDPGNPDIRFSRGGTGTGEKKKDVPTIGADMSEPGNAKAFRKYLSTRDAAPMPERLKDGRPRNVLQWFTENMVGKTFEFDIPGIGHREFRVKAGHLFRLVCDTPKGRSSSGKTIRKGFVGKAKDADEARRLIETGEVTTGDIAGWNEGRARSLPLIPEILESFDAVFREKARPGFLVFVKKFVSKSGHVNTVVMRLNEDGETLGPMSAHMKGITAEWLKGQDLAITDDGKVFTRQENSASSQVDSQDNAEGNSRANAESISQDGADGNGDLRLSRGYRPGDWRKTFTFGKAARGAAEQTNGGIAAGEERRRWEENPVDERIPEWDAPARNPNIAKPFALSSAEGVRLVKLLGGTMKKPKAYKDAIGVIDESDEQRIRDDLKGMGFFKGDDFLWAATATPAEVAADRADSQAALDARLEKLGEQRLKGEAGGGNRGLVRVSMSQVADLVLSLPAETGGNLGNVRTLAQGIVRGFERDRTPEQAAYYLQEAQNLIGWFYGHEGDTGPRPGGSSEGTPPQGARDVRKMIARAFGAFLEAPDAVAERAPGLYREFVDAIGRNDKLLHAFDAIRRTALGEGSAARVYAEIEAGRTAQAEEAARRLADEVEKPIGSRLERAKDSFIYNFDDMHGPIFMHITRAQKRQLAELKASLKAGRITQAEYDAATAAFRTAVQGLKIAELKVDRGTQNEIRQYLWDMSFVFEQAKAAGVDPKDAQRYMDLRWIVSTGGRAGARGMSARDAQIVLDNMKRNMGDEAFARLEGVSAQFHAVREKNILDDPRLAAMIGQDRVNFYKNNVHYVRTERTRATPEELAQMEADRAAFRRENKGDDDVTAAMLSLLDKTGGRGGGIGNSTWGHALEGSVKDVKDRLAATWRNDTRLMAAMERNDFVIRMRDALLAAKAEGVHDLPGSRGVDYPQNARYGHIRYFENGRQRVLVVPRVLADGYRQVSDAMTGWSAWGKIAHGVFIDWNLAYTLRNMTRNMASNESNIVGMRADNATILGNAIAPGVGRAASMAAYQIARHLPSAVFRNPFARAVFGEFVNVAEARQAQRILELYLDPKKAVARQAAAEEARLRGETGPAMELDADLELMRFMTKGGALISRWDEVQGAGRDADLFMQGRGLGPIYGDADASAPKSLARKIGGVLSYPFRRNAQFNRDLELHAKITATLAIHEMQPGLTAEQVGIEVARRASIPHAERSGALGKFINYAYNIFFSTALKGGQRFVGNVVRNPRLLGKMAAQSLGPQLFWATMIAGGGLAAVIRNMFGGGDDAEEKARQAGLGWLLDYTQFMHDGSLAASQYLQRFYHWCPLGQVGERYIGIALPRTDEEKMLLPFIDWVAAQLAPQPTDPTATLGDAVKRSVVGTFVPDLTARTPLVAAAQDLVFAWWQNPMDTYRGTHVYDNSLWQARGESLADAAAFAWATAKQGFNDLGGRTIVRPRRNEIEVAEGSGAQPPSFAEKAWDTILNDIPVLSGVLGGSLRMTLTKEQRLDQIEREALAPIRAVKNRRSEEIMKMMLESPVANNGSETPEIKEKLDAWAKRYGWDEAERGNVFARAFNGYQAATGAGQELAAQKKEKNRRVRYNKMPNSEKKAVEAAGLREILAE